MDSPSTIRRRPTKSFSEYDARRLAGWLEANCDPGLIIGGDYTVAELVADLRQIDEYLMETQSRALDADA